MINSAPLGYIPGSVHVYRYRIEMILAEALEEMFYM